MRKANEHLPLLEALTERETEILACLADGLSNSEIAEKLFLAPSTAKWYVRQLNSKFGTENRAAILASAQRLGLLDRKSPQGITKHNLPAQTTPFVGRDRELDELYRLLNRPDVRLLTILAPGGMGKTRLTLEAAEQQLYHFRDGVYFVPLQALSEAEHIITAIAEHTGFQFHQDSRDPKRQVLDYLSNKHMLLLLDNCEHLLDGAPLITEILQAAPGVKALATSREKLNLSGETVYNLSGMAFPTQSTSEDVLDFDAAQLLVRTAQRVRPDFVLSDNDLPAVTRICQLVEGMPLGIELAAGWVDILSLQTIADELERGMDILETEFRDAPARQRSIRATFRVTWERLAAEEQAAFRRLSVFRGGFTVEAAQAVAGADVRLLRRLANKALLRHPTAERYDVHELLRQYAEEQLDAAGETEAARDAHMNHYADLLHALEADLKGRRQLGAMDEIEADFDNLRAAWHWALGRGDYTAIDRMVEALWLFASMRSRFQDAAEVFARAIKRLSAEPADRHPVVVGRVLSRRGLIIAFLGQLTESEAILRSSLEIARQREDRAEIALSLGGLGYAVGSQGREAEGLQLVNESLALYSELGDKWGMGWAHYLAGSFTSGLGQFEQGYQHLLQGLALHRETGDQFGIASSLNDLGAYFELTGQKEQAYRWHRESLALSREIGDQQGIAWSLVYLVGFPLLRGRLEEAEDMTREILAIATKISDPSLIAGGLCLSGAIAEARGDDAEAHRLACESLPYAEAGYNAGVKQGVRDLMASTLCSLGAYDAVIDYLNSYLKAWSKRKLAAVAPNGVATAARIAAHRGQHGRAVELLGLLFSIPCGSVAWWDNHPHMKRLRVDLEAELGAEAYRAAWEHGKSLELNAVMQELLDEFGNQ